MQPCSDCRDGIDRRHFLTTAAGAAAAATALPALTATAAPTPKSDAENSVRRLYDTLTEDQKKIVALPLDDSRRNTINPNWNITKYKIGQFSSDQKEIIKDVIRGITSEDGYDRIIKQMAHDKPPGLNTYSVALFGNPHEKEFEFELTGRHLTMRADGNTKKGVAFGGPIVYGHGAKGNSSKNLFSYQTKVANELFKALDGKQREKALLDKAPQEAAVRLRKEGRPLPGIAGGDLSADQKELLEHSLKAVMRPYRKEDVDEVLEILKAGGGLDKLQIAYYKQGDLNNDQEWDIWRLEAPTLVCHFRGAPHVHAYINVARRS